MSLSVDANEETQLMADLFKNYNKNIRPTEDPDDKVLVQVKLILTNLISLVKTDRSCVCDVYSGTNFRLRNDDFTLVEHNIMTTILILKRHPNLRIHDCGPG